MYTHFHSGDLTADAAATLSPLDLDTVDVRQLARRLRTTPGISPPHFLIDCRHLRTLRTQGVSYVISQLLLLCQAGAAVHLANPTPVLRRCLRILQLQYAFTIHQTA